MISVSADTLSTARRLQNEFGMDQRASEGVAIAIHEHLIQNVATKDDLALMQAELEKQIVATRDDMTLTRAELEKRIEAVRSELKQDIAATRGDVTLTRAELEKQIEAVRSELKQDIADVRQEVAGVRVELHQEIVGVRREIAETNRRIDGLHTEIANEFKVLYRYLWGMGAGIIAVIVALLKLF